jgi:low affinity Fe/Cu permease
MITTYTSMMKYIRRALTFLGVSASRPIAFVVVGAYVAAWLFFDHKTLDWQGIATIATWTMTLFIQRAERRDTQAIHAKVDELLRTEARARNELTKVDGQQPEEIEAHRKAEAEKLA